MVSCTISCGFHRALSPHLTPSLKRVARRDTTTVLFTKLLHPNVLRSSQGVPQLRSSQGIPQLRSSQGVPQLRSSQGVPQLRSSQGIPQLKACLFFDIAVQSLSLPASAFSSLDCALRDGLS
ncbi:hypothetical protein PoB_000619700 [Plakobranchus ocellatus]|uniref:Uncharacterized protein n=1 Tax=Plakobranchus ocellatus TaxID=259542 RepID=A0AAV3YB81_9GAST|nr:hypothetical protein PoB_000619700 [Plakobranchus ocellatus]